MKLESIIGDRIEKAHKVLLSMSVDQDNIDALGLFNDDIKTDYEKLRNRLIGVYDSNQQLLKVLPKEVRELDI